MPLARDRTTAVLRRARRSVGAVLLVLVAAPWYRLLSLRATGPSAEQTLRLGAQYFLAHWAGLVLGAVLIVVLSRLLAPAWLAPLWATARRWLLHPPVVRLGLVLGALATAISLWVSIHALNLRPILIDGVSQLIQARYFSAGMLAGPVLSDPEFWQFQFMMQTDAGWASQYPPGFPALLALAWAGGLPWLLGPLLLGMTVLLTTLISERLFPHDRIAARLGALLTSVSLFLAFHAGAYMSHVLATALVVLAVWASLRSVDGSWRWALLSGAAVGGLFATRPYVGVVLGFFATVIVWAGAPAHPGFTRRQWLWRLGAAAAGAVPLVAAVMAYNARLFGGATRFGYVAAAGPAHGLGFHMDPWGSMYGLPEAVGYTSADLLGLSLDLVQTPLPAVVIVALYLLRAKGLDRGVRLVALWALLPVAANALYWHHDLFMGPRLLYEAAPGWCLLLGVASLRMVGALPEKQAGTRLSRVCTRTGVAAVLTLALAMGVAFWPAKLRGYAALSQRTGMGLEAPEVRGPSLVFVHEDWESRLGARLSAQGMRLDSIRGALRHNTTCEVQMSVSAYEDGGRDVGLPMARLDFAPGSGRPMHDVRMPSGSRIRTYEGETLSTECERQAASDYAGVLALAPLLWQGDLPGLGERGAMFVRDFGPERNARLLARFPDREAHVLVRRGNAEPSLLPYERGMAELWASP